MGATESLKFLLFGEDRSASDALNRLGTKARTTSQSIGSNLSKIGDMIGGDIGLMLDRVGTGLDQAGEKSASTGAKMAATGTIVTGVGALMQQVASGDIAAQQQLAAAVDATGKSYDEFGRDVDSLIDKQTEFGNTDGDVKDALRSLVQAYDDPKVALEQMGLATDLAAAKGISLGEAATMVGKAHNGSAKWFKEFGIVVGKNADGTADYDGALAELSTKLSGQASAAVDNFSGKLGEQKAKLENAASAFAEKYGPAITMGGAALTGIGVAVQGFVALKNMEILTNIRSAAATAASTTATVAGSIASKAAAAGQWLLNAALAANPIGIVVVALAALAAGLVYAYKHSETFRRVVKGAFDVIAGAARFLWNNALQPVIQFILRGFAAVAEKIGKVIIGISNIPGFGWAKTAGEAMLTAAGKASALADSIKKIPDHKDVTVNVRGRVTSGRLSVNGERVNIGMFADGGRPPVGRLSIVGERGPEFFVPDEPGTVIDAETTRAMMQGGRRGFGSAVSATSAGDSRPIVVQLVLDSRVIHESLLKRKRQSGVELGLA